MGPEVIVAHRAGKEYEGRAADVYATGVTLFTLVTASEPFVSSDIDVGFATCFSDLAATRVSLAPPIGSTALGATNQNLKVLAMRMPKSPAPEQTRPKSVASIEF